MGETFRMPSYSPVALKLMLHGNRMSGRLNAAESYSRNSFFDPHLFNRQVDDVLTTNTITVSGFPPLVIARGCYIEHKWRRTKLIQSA